MNIPPPAPAGDSPERDFHPRLLDDVCGSGAGSHELSPDFHDPDSTEAVDLHIPIADADAADQPWMSSFQQWLNSASGPHGGIWWDQCEEWKLDNGAVEYVYFLYNASLEFLVCAARQALLSAGAPSGAYATLTCPDADRAGQQFAVT